MAFLDTTAAGTTVKEWQQSAFQSINNLTALKASLAAQLTNMRTNNDYNDADISEMVNVIDDINVKIAAL